NELPNNCEFGDFVTEFDLDGDGVFTLNDLNHPSDGGALEDALDELDTCMDYSPGLGDPTHFLNPDWEATKTNDGTGDPWDSEVGLYQGQDLLNAFEDGCDGWDSGGGCPNDDDSYVDDFFGAFFTNCDTLDGCTITGDVDPDEYWSGTEEPGMCAEYP